MALAEEFLAQQRDALVLAFRSRMDEAIGQPVEDGAPAFEAARGWGLAALALAPGDRMLRMLVDDLGHAAGVAAASKLPVRLKGDPERRAREARYDRLPTDLAALTTALVTARDQGHHTLMLFLAGHGLTLTRRRPFGEGSREHLMFRRHRAEALKGAGHPNDAFTEAEPLVREFKALFGERATETFYARHLLAQCRQATGDAAGALREVEDLLPLMTEVRGSRHPDVLATRFLLAQCRLDTGDVAGALREVEDLLPLRTEVQGPRHPDVLRTRILHASCLLETGDQDGAVAAIEGVRDGLVAAGLRPEHRYFRRLEEVEEGLRRLDGVRVEGRSGPLSLGQVAAATSMPGESA